MELRSQRTKRPTGFLSRREEVSHILQPPQGSRVLYSGHGPSRFCELGMA
jgi:hypothetical protein